MFLLAMFYPLMERTMVEAQSRGGAYRPRTLILRDAPYPIRIYLMKGNLCAGDYVIDHRSPLEQRLGRNRV